MLRHRLTDEQWDLIADLFSKRKKMGRPPRDRREVFDGILWVLRTGAPWRDVPQEFGPWGTVWDLFDTWNADGTLVAALQRLQSQVAIDAELWCIDGTSIRAARCAAGGGKKGIPTNRRTTRWAEVAAVLPAKSTSCAMARATRCTSN